MLPPSNETEAEKILKDRVLSLAVEKTSLQNRLEHYKSDLKAAEHDVYVTNNAIDRVQGEIDELEKARKVLKDERESS